MSQSTGREPSRCLGGLSRYTETVLLSRNHREWCEPRSSNPKESRGGKKVVAERGQSVWEDTKKVGEALKKAGKIIRAIPRRDIRRWALGRGRCRCSKSQFFSPDFFGKGVDKVFGLVV